MDLSTPKEVVLTVEREKLVEKETAQCTGYQAAKCPYCGQVILIPKYKPVPITEEEFRRRVQNEADYQKRLTKGEKLNV